VSKTKSLTAIRKDQTSERSNTNVMMQHMVMSNRQKPYVQQVIDLQQSLRKTARQIDNLKAKLQYQTGEEKKQTALKIWHRERVFNEKVFKLSLLAKRQTIKSFNRTLNG
jgi:TolA-binding protein